MSIYHKDNVKIKTKDLEGNANGFLIPIINQMEDTFLEKERWPKQVYCTVVAPKKIKGPHLHRKRWGLFTCIKGDIVIVVRQDDIYSEYHSGENYNYRTIQVPAGIPAALVNVGECDAYVLNMPSPAWSKEDEDDWDVSFGDYDFEKLFLM